MATRHTEGGASAPPAAANNVVPFRRPQREPEWLIIRSPVPDPAAMEPGDYEDAWVSLCLYAEAARHAYSLAETSWVLAVRLGDAEETQRLDQLRGPSFQRMLAFVTLVGTLPVPQTGGRSMVRQYIRRKARIIGRIWMKAEGERYSVFRASVAADKAMLACVGQGR